MVFQSAMNSLNPVITIFEQFRDVIVRHTGANRGRGAGAGRGSDATGRHSARRGSTTIRTSFPAACGSASCWPSRWRSSPKLIIMDEPTTALDVVVQREILQEIMVLKARLGFSILLHHP